MLAKNDGFGCIETAANVLPESSDHCMGSMEIWRELLQSARHYAVTEPLLTRVLKQTVLGAVDLGQALAWRLGALYADVSVGADAIAEVAADIFAKCPELVRASCADLRAVRRNDPAVDDLLVPFLFFKGFSALACHRVSNYLWTHERRPLALHLQHRLSTVAGVDIHPAALIGQGVSIDHATGLVVGETAVISDNVTMYHNITLGGTGKERGIRHPTIGKNVLIGAGATILGNIQIGDNARIGAGSVVLVNVPPFCLATGVPAHVRPIGETAFSVVAKRFLTSSHVAGPTPNPLGEPRQSRHAALHEYTSD
jgi:serine O-acetyltransferase